MTVVIPGNKFAVVGLSTNWIASDLPDEVAVGDVVVHRRLPIPFSQFWVDNLGHLRVNELKQGDLFILAQDHAKAPDILDAENQQLLKRVWRFYFALLVATPYISHQRGMKVTGADAGDGANIRQVQEISSVHFTFGSPKQDLGLEHLNCAATIADAIDRLSGGGEHSRFWRITHAFYDAVRAQEPGQRIHQFVRCVEGFILPSPGRTERQFVSRTELFVGPRHHDTMRNLFEIRSAVEHLHGPLSAITAATERERRLVLLLRACEAEALARHCLRRLLMTPPLEEWFEDDTRLADFWKLSEADRRALWGPLLDFQAASDAFSSRYIDDDDLGLS